ncbi:MAG: adenylate/guanylate cyclase domain-containing protein [Myxococcota bacterium]
MSDRPKAICKLSYQLGGDPKSHLVRDASLTIGRSSGCDLVLADESVSRKHACITRTQRGWLIRDLDSKNGIKVNTFRTREQELCDGDRVDLGSIRLYVEIKPASETSEPNVVFEKEEHEARRTEVISMDELDAVLGISDGPRPDASPAAARAESGPAPEPDGFVSLVSKAAEALLSCDSLDETLERILALVFDNLPVERGVICLYDESTDTSEPKVMRTREGVPDEPISISTNIANDVIKRKQSLLVQDTQMDERFGSAESVIMMQIRSAMCAPLYREGRVAGFIYVDRQSTHQPLTAVHLQALSTLAILSAVAVEQTALRDAIRNEQEMRARLARYSSPAVVDQIVGATGGSEWGMVAEEGEVTVLFADLTGFTSLAERLSPPEVVLMLNEVFERLTEVIFYFEGTLDKFRGDGLMAFFGAPLPMPDHAERAVDAALRMQVVLAERNAYASDGRSLSMRIGINSGPVVVGDIGSPQRKDYTVIGDVVNVASRLESSVAQPGQVVVGPTTRAQLGPRFECQALEEVSLKGKQESVLPFRVVERLDLLEEG